MNHFKGRHFQKDIILVAVGYYFRFISAIVTSLNCFGIGVSLFITPRSYVGFITMAPSLRLYDVGIKQLTLKVGESMRPIFELKAVGPICIALLTVTV
ncbi:hypothetical protein WTH01_16930 [Weissella thailandensis]|nr:hypothetical protein WTH01_16930 [Weissella thailandensis]